MAYTARTVRTINVDVQEDSVPGNAPPGGGAWSVEAVGFESEFTCTGTGDATPISPTLGSVYDGREYDITFTPEANYGTPNPPNIVASATPQEFTGNYLSTAGTIYYDNPITAGEPAPWGFLSPQGGEWATQLNTVDVANTDASGVSISAVTDPRAGADAPLGGDCLRFYTNVGDADGWRNQTGIRMYQTAQYPGLEAFIKTGAQIYVSMETYFPAAFTMTPVNPTPWLSIMDWHVHNDPTGGWWHTNPGVFMHEDGSNKVRFEWGSSGYQANSSWSATALPVGQWFEFEMTWALRDTQTANVQIWVNGTSFLQQANCRTSDDVSVKNECEYFLKQYGQNRNDTTVGQWDMPLLRYNRNFKVSDQPQTF